jgi:hypothetical protein
MIVLRWPSDSDQHCSESRKSARKERGAIRSVALARLLRVFVLPEPDGGKIEVAVRSARTANAIAEYDNAVKQYIYTGNSSALSRFNSRTIATAGKRVAFLTDLRRLDRLARAGALSFDSIYAPRWAGVTKSNRKPNAVTAHSRMIRQKRAHGPMPSAAIAASRTRRRSCSAVGQNAAELLLPQHGSGANR